MMRTGRSSGLRWTTCAFGAAVAVAELVYWTFSSIGIRVNASPSLPIGLYRIDSGPQASNVEFCPAEPYGVTNGLPHPALALHFR